MSGPSCRRLALRGAQRNRATSARRDRRGQRCAKELKRVTPADVDWHGLSLECAEGGQGKCRKTHPPAQRSAKNLPLLPL